MSSRKIIETPKETQPLLSYAAAPGGTEYNQQQTVEQSEESRGGSVTIVILTVFLQSIGFTITLPSMAFYLTHLHVITTSNSTFYGWIVAIYSVGQFLGSPLFGYWSNHAPQRYSIIASLFISALGNILYGFVALLPYPGWMMLISRFLVGLGAGNVAVCRAYASEASTLANRAGTMAKMSMAQGMGFVVGPILGFLLSYCHFNIGIIPVNKFTAPGFISAVFGIFNTVFAGVLFKELNSRTKGLDRDKIQAIDKPTRAELIPMLISIFLFFVVIAVFSIFETMLTLVTQHDFGWGTTENGILFISVGALSVVVFAIISTPTMKKKEDRKMMIFGTVLQIAGLAIAATWVWPIKIQTKLTYEQFYTAAALIGIGYPITSAYMFAIYSKVLNPSFQGTKMGWLTSGGSLARMLGPIWAVHAYHFGGGELLFMGTDMLVIVSLFVLIIYYERLGPHPSYFNPNSPPTKMSFNAEDAKNFEKVSVQ